MYHIHFKCNNNWYYSCWSLLLFHKESIQWSDIAVSRTCYSKVKHVVHVIDITCLNPSSQLVSTFCLIVFFFNRVWKQTAMALKPLLKSKVDELFARWLSDPETQLNLKENLRQLCQGESITLQHLTSPKSSSKQSPRLRPSSPPYSPNSTKLPNPRSPRRALSNKNKANNGSPRVSLLYNIFFYYLNWYILMFLKIPFL